MDWPSHYPANCPPASGSPAQGEVLRYIEGDEPGPRDFLSYKELRPTEDFRDECKSRGVSVYRDHADLESLARRIAAYRTKRIVIAALTPSAGITLPTPSRVASSHVTWWVPVGVEAWKLFH